MRFLLFISFLFSISSNSQLPEKLKYDELIYSKDSSRVLIHYKKQSALYSFSDKKFISFLSKNQIFYMPGSDCFGEISDVDGRISLHLVIDDESITTIGSDEQAYAYFQHDTTIGIGTNGLAYDPTSKEMTKEYWYSEYWFRENAFKRISIEKINGQFVIINDYLRAESEYDNDFSGVYDLSLRKWVIEPEYHECYVVNDYIFCLGRKPIEVLENEGGPYDEWWYDLFQIKGTEVIKVKSNIRSKSELDIPKILNTNEAHVCADSSLYIVEKDGKKGLICFELFYYSGSSADFIFNEVLKPLANYIYFSDELNKIAVVYNDSIEKVVLFQYIEDDAETIYANDQDTIGRRIIYINEAKALVSDQKRVGYHRLHHYNWFEESLSAGSCEYYLNRCGFCPEYRSEGSDHKRANFGLDLINDTLLIVNEYGEDIKEMIYSYYGEDSLDAEGNYVWTIYEPHYERSGVRNIKSGQWIIEPIYQQCFTYNNFVFCYKIVDIKDETFSCDIYEVTNTGIKKIHSDIRENGLIDVAPFFVTDNVQVCADSVHYIVERNNQKSFGEFKLFNSIYYWYGYNFEAKTFQEPIADFLYFSEGYQKIVAVHLDSSKKVSLYHCNVGSYGENFNIESVEHIINDESTVGFGSPEMPMLRAAEYVFTQSSRFGINFESSGFTLTEEPMRDNNTANVGIKLINDSLVIVNDFLLDYYEKEFAFKSQIYPDEDSIVFDSKTGNQTTVYPDPIPGYDRSGVYNLKSDKWILPNSAQYIEPTGYGFLVRNTIRNSEFGTITGHDYSFIGFDGEQIFTHKTSDELIADLNLLRYCVKGLMADSLFEGPNGIERHSQIKNGDKNYYIVSGNKLGMYNPNSLQGQFQNEIIVAPEEFVHVLPELNIKLWMDGDSIFFTSHYDSVAVSKNNGKIIYWRAENYWGNEGAYRLLIIENNDSTLIGNVEQFNGNFAFLSIEIKDGFLIVNDCTKSGPNYWYNSQFGQIYLNRDLESENSSVWKFLNGRWQKISPYYASIEAIPNGYIAKTGNYFHEYNAEMDDAWFEPQVEDELRKEFPTIKVPSRYFLLDSNLNVISYLDYFDYPLIEDLGFGLKVCSDNGGCFFMTYDYVSVTNAEWDDFELEDGKLKAIKNEVPMINEYGEQLYDENFTPIMLSQSVISWFNMP